MLRAEPIVTPAGIVDADEKNVKFNCNVETENGVETRTETIRTRDADDIGRKRLAKKLGATGTARSKTICGRTARGVFFSAL